jgi:hypothetical protein
MSTLRPVNVRAEDHSINLPLVAAVLVAVLVNFAIWTLLIVLVRSVV